MYRESVLVIKTSMLSFQSEYPFWGPWKPKQWFSKNVHLYVWCYRCVDPRLVQNQPDIFCSNVHTTCILGRNRCNKYCFRQVKKQTLFRPKISNFLKSCTVYVWKNQAVGPIEEHHNLKIKVRLWASNLKIRTYILQQAFLCKKPWKSVLAPFILKAVQMQLLNRLKKNLY